MYIPKQAVKNVKRRVQEITGTKPKNFLKKLYRSSLLKVVLRKNFITKWWVGELNRFGKVFPKYGQVARFCSLLEPTLKKRYQYTGAHRFDPKGLVYS